MSKFRRAARIDSNQPDIVRDLRMIPGCTVETGKDDILVGYKGRTYWFEIKTPDCVSPVSGKILESEKKPDQKRLEKEWPGHYRIVSSIAEIFSDMGIVR